MFFFVKQKTEYELRMSDWSSDVCSSDLFKRRFHGPVHDRIAHEEEFDPRPRDEPILPRFVGTVIDPQLETAIVCKVQLMILDRLDGLRRSVVGGECEGCVRRLGIRSEEHTSELQSLMRISYAVFCLKKKKKKP